MIDWRTILKAPPYTQNTQNPQNGERGDNFEDIEDIEHRGLSADTSVKSIKRDDVSVLRPGDQVAWDSPLFGYLEGELLAILENGMIAVFHPLKDGVAEIPVSWLIQRRTA